MQTGGKMIIDDSDGDGNADVAIIVIIAILLSLDCFSHIVILIYDCY